MNKKTLTPIAAALGTAFAISVAATPVAAAENPFGMSDLANGHQLAKGDKPEEGKCGGDKKTEGKCGGDKPAEGKCGAEKKTEGKCGASKCGGK